MCTNHVTSTNPVLTLPASPADEQPPRSWKSKAPARLPPALIVAATLSSIAALVALVVIGDGLHQVVLIPPLAASMALVAGAPGLPLAQPRNVIGGQLVSASVGLLVTAVAGTSMWWAAVAGGLALGAMLVLRTSHSPAAATAVIAAHAAPGPLLFLSLLTLATVVLVCIGIIGARAAGNRQYPVYWW